MAVHGLEDDVFLRLKVKTDILLVLELREFNSAVKSFDFDDRNFLGSFLPFLVAEEVNDLFRNIILFLIKVGLLDLLGSGFLFKLCSFDSAVVTLIFGGVESNTMLAT